MNHQILINNFTKGIFWDVDIETLNIQEHKYFIINRVVQYGLMSDWENLKSIYSRDEILDETAKNKSLDIKTAHFLSLISGKPLTEFRCYTTKQSIPPQMNF